MNQDILNFTIEKTRELISAPTCSPETKAAAQAWLDAVGCDTLALETQRYIDELEVDIVPIDNLINLAESDAGAKIFGDAAPDVAAHAREIKAAGAKYCDCPACVAVAAILERKDELLK